MQQDEKYIIIPLYNFILCYSPHFVIWYPFLILFLSWTGMAGLGQLGVYIISAASGGLPSEEVTFAKVAKQQGYETALIGEPKSSPLLLCKTSLGPWKTLRITHLLSSWVSIHFGNREHAEAVTVNLIGCSDVSVLLFEGFFQFWLYMMIDWLKLYNSFSYSLSASLWLNRQSTFTCELTFKVLFFDMQHASQAFQ